MPERWVDNLAAAAQRGTSRKGFMQAITATAAVFAASPVRKASGFTATLEQANELAFMASCAAGKCGGDGFHEFCCATNGGSNVCPDYAYFGGYWRASPYSGGGYCYSTNVRYYIDCNVFPNRGTDNAGHCTCRCGNRDCNCRNICCREFVYGNCNSQHSSTPTDVVCRVVKCSRPDTYGYNCSSSYTSLDETRNHEPCRGCNF